MMSKFDNLKTPEQRYNNDPLYYHLVNMIEKMISDAVFSPSEIREAAMLACIHHEFRTNRTYLVPKEVETALEILEKFRAGKE